MSMFIFPLEPVTVNTGALATEVTLSAINTKIPASPAAEHTTAASPNAARLSDGSAFYKATTPSDTQPVSVASLPLPSGAATEASLASLNAKVTAVNTGAVVVSSSALPSGAATSAKQDTQIAAVQRNVVDQIDTTPLLDTSSSNIPASASNPLQVVSSTAAICYKLVSVEDIGEFIGVYIGAALSETLLCVLPLGGGEMTVNIPASTRISLRNMKNAVISSGTIAINFIG